MGFMMWLAQVFPTDTVSLNLITNVKQDLVGWGVAIIGVFLIVLASRVIKRLAYGR